MRATVNSDCIGCGLCAGVCPAVFALENGKAVPVCEEIPAAQLPDAQAAREGCPVAAIDILE